MNKGKRLKEKRRLAKLAERRQWQMEEDYIQQYRRKGPYVKTIMRDRGYNLKFFDRIDSYISEYSKIADFAKVRYPSLLGIHEVANDIFEAPENYWSRLGCDGLERIMFAIADEFANYGHKS